MRKNVCRILYILRLMERRRCRVATGDIIECGSCGFVANRIAMLAGVTAIALHAYHA